ncbi:MAG: hypothetical protein HC884_12130, partial [Chloroflexaceae bacterium]|nr:hypothetical protein [Chloroflexaceae bacterium]
AEAIARNDPLVRHRVDSYELREWQITDGLDELTENWSISEYPDQDRLFRAGVGNIAVVRGDDDEDEAVRGKWGMKTTCEP